ncbi:MAG TPA: aminotransferase class V-fold PLP-dependent enzyme [Myxococcaceae bacterium]
MSTPRKPATDAIHAGSRLPDTSAIPITPAIHTAAVSWFDSSDELDAALDGNDFVYTRIRGENPVLLEEAVAALEGAESSAVFGSGMAALRAVFDEQALSPGDRVVLPVDGYGATRALFKRLADQHKVELFPLKLSDPSSLERFVAIRPKLVLSESMTNPLLAVPDLPSIAHAAHAAGAALLVDGTFTSPAIQRTLSQGADYALHSTTKWINGHSDATGGVVSGSRARIDPLRGARVLEGALLGPFEAWLTLRGLRTLPIRMAAHSTHALHVARRLREDGRIARVLYPGLPDHPDHATARALFQGGFGGMVAFEIAGAGRAESFRFLEALRLCRPAPSLGDVTTLVMHAASASARRLTPEERATAGIGENLIRVSVGLEDPDDVAEDLLQALQAVGQS